MDAVTSFFSALSWQQPLWLLALPLAAGAGLGYRYWRRTCAETGSKLARHIDPALLPQLVTDRQGGRRTIGWLLALLWTLTTVAAAGPYLSQASQGEESLPGANVVLIVDISPSMSVADIPPNRIRQATLQLSDFIRQLHNTRLALITFSANAYAILPLTSDRETVIHFVHALDPSLVTVAGSNLGRALKLAREALDEPPAGGGRPASGIAVLISDGGIHDNDAWEEAARLKRQGHRLFTIGVGTEAGGPVPLMLGQLVRQDGAILTSARQRQTLTALARRGGGAYHDLSPAGWEALQGAIGQLEQRLYEATPTTQHDGRLYTALGLVVIALLLLYGWRRPEALAAICLLPALLLLSPAADASPWLEREALQALERGDYADAARLYERIESYQGFFGQGVAAYRQRQWAQALSAFNQAYTAATNAAQRASAAYNLANTLTQLGEIDEAIAAYRRCLSHNPDHAKANRNLALLKRHELMLGLRAEQSGQQSRPGPGQLDEESRPAGGTPTTAQGATTQSGEGGGGQQGREEQQLARSLKRWSQITEADGDTPAHAIQQLHNLQDDSSLMLRRRFSIEDERAIGLVEEKPW